MRLHIYKNDIVYGMHLSIKSMCSRQCEGCAYGKNACKPFPKQQSSPQVEKAGESFHTDICGPMSVTSYGVTKYFVIFKDDYTGFRFLYYIRSKLEVFEKFN